MTREAFLKNLVSTIYYTLNSSYNVLAANLDHDYTWTNQQGTILYAIGKYQEISLGVWCAAVSISPCSEWLSVAAHLLISMLPAVNQGV